MLNRSLLAILIASIVSLINVWALEWQYQLVHFTAGKLVVLFTLNILMSFIFTFFFEWVKDYLPRIFLVRGVLCYALMLAIYLPFLLFCYVFTPTTLYELKFLLWVQMLSLLPLVLIYNF